MNALLVLVLVFYSAILAFVLGMYFYVKNDIRKRKANTSVKASVDLP